MEEPRSPRVVTSKRRIKYRKSSWRIHNFEVWSGELLCRVVVLRMEGSALLWIGSDKPELGEVALGMPAQIESRGALSSSLFGVEIHIASGGARTHCRD
ncbi:unnamed protein product [Parnassius apollo]|uniref:(apollo) hypothetical protein n=1 Tax=Parnassius apollo TaxID=110799 RepID=A0A8S3XLG7_PARAO|nr:unnamed protein product [Parnassius apollo]